MGTGKMGRSPESGPCLSLNESHTPSPWDPTPCCGGTDQDRARSQMSWVPHPTGSPQSPQLGSAGCLAPPEVRVSPMPRNTSEAALGPLHG